MRTPMRKGTGSLCLASLDQHCCKASLSGDDLPKITRPFRENDVTAMVEKAA